MERFYAQIFCHMSFGLGGLMTVDADHPTMHAVARESADKWKGEFRDKALKVRSWLETGFPMSLKYIDESYLPALEYPVTLGKLNELNCTLEQRIRDELSLQTFLRVPSDRARFYEKARDQWIEGIAKFPSISFDAEEASKCYALERSTAAVFHMMRILESPLAVIARELGVVKQSPTWNAYLVAFRTAAATKFPAPHGPDKRMRDYYAALEAQLSAIKDAFRNATMHSLERTYTQEQAHELFILLRGFLREAGKELSE
jgi:hypothetical protein